MAREILTVRIDGHDYRVRLGDQDPAYIERLAQHVDLRIAEIRKATGLKDNRLLVLVCLNLADEFHRAQAAQATAPETAPVGASADGSEENGAREEDPSAYDVLTWIRVILESKGDVVPPWPQK